MKRRGKKKSPSRERYERSHPTVSARLPLASRDLLLAKMKTLNMSLPEAFKVLTGDLQIKAKPIEEAKKEGFQQGYQKALSIYMVSYPCSRCGKLLFVTTAEEKRAIKSYMKENNWGHEECTKNI
jgi:hypothetical protein